MNICTFLLCTSLPVSTGPALPDSLFQHGYYRAAAEECRRGLYETLRHPDSSAAACLALKLGLSLGADGDLSSAAAALRQTADLNPDLAHDAGVAMAGLRVGDRQYAKARLGLSDMMVFVHESTARQSLQAKMAWLSLQEHDLAGAAGEFDRAGRPGLAAKVRELGRVRGRSPTLAMLMSSLLPGTGEIYAGHPATGLLSLLVTGGSAAGVYWATRSDDWVSASVLLSVLFLRFYNGSRMNAAAFADEFNQRLFERRVNELEDAEFVEPDWFEGVRAFVGPDFVAGFRTRPPAESGTSPETE